MAVKIEKKSTSVRIQPAKAPRAPLPTLKKTGRDEMSTGKGAALRKAAVKNLGAAPFSASVEVVGKGLPTSAAPPAEKILNQPLYDFLEANPKIKTVQDLVNASYKEPGGGWDTFEKHCTELGLDPKELNKYRTANLSDWAAVSAPAEGVPHTVEEANAFFINQYKTDFNAYAADGVSNNCGPTSLAMCLQVEGKMPPGLNPEQRIDYARALMYPDLEASAYQVVKDADGVERKLLDRDKALTALGDGTAGIIGGASEVGITTKKETGWAAFDDALNSGNPVVVEGNINSDWRKAVASHPPGSYAGGGDGHFIAVLGKTADGKYLVADPMYSGGTVEMTRDELAKFFAKQGGAPSFAQI